MKLAVEKGSHSWMCSSGVCNLLSISWFIYVILECAHSDENKLINSSARGSCSYMPFYSASNLPMGTGSMACTYLHHGYPACDGSPLEGSTTGRLRCEGGTTFCHQMLVSGLIFTLYENQIKMMTKQLLFLPAIMFNMTSDLMVKHGFLWHSANIQCCPTKPFIILYCWTRKALGTRIPKLKCIFRRYNPLGNLKLALALSSISVARVYDVGISFWMLSMII